MINININFEKNKYKSEIKSDDIALYISKYYNNKLSSSYLFHSIDLNYNIVSAITQKSINTEFLNHNWNTDIITFNHSEDDNSINGDIYINLKQVKKNALKYKSTFECEINRVFIHGLFHLLGYEDKTTIEFKLMKKEENKFLKYISKKFHVEPSNNDKH